MKTVERVSFLVILVLFSVAAKCQSVFKAGSGSTYIEFHVGPNGNVTYLQTGTSGVVINGNEGYVICVNTGAAYYDLGGYGDSGNWQAAVVSQPHGPNTFPLSITRTTADGVYTLTQTYAWGNSKTGAKISMVVQSDNGNQYDLVRYAEFSQPNGWAAQSSITAYAWVNGAIGLLMAPSSVNRVRSGLGQAGISPGPCTGGVGVPSPYQGQADTMLGWTLDGRKTNTATLVYSPLR